MLRHSYGAGTMPDTVFLINENRDDLNMRHRRLFEYTLVIILIAVIILQWLSHSSNEQKWLSNTQMINEKLEIILKQNGVTAERAHGIQILLDTNVKNVLRSQGKEFYHNKPTIYAVTPTFARPVQKAELTRLAQTFLHVPTFHWIIVEDSVNKTKLVTNFLAESGLAYTHLVAATPTNYKLGKNDPNWKKPRGVEQRNAALKWLRDNAPARNNSIVFFADDDNTYSLKLFEEMEKIKNVGVWPVGLVGGLMVEKPICDKETKKVLGFNSAWKPDRPFPLDMAGFAFNLRLLLDNNEAWFSFEVEAGYQESEILRHITTRDQLEPLADLCTKVYVWHTRTEPPKLGAEQLLIKKGKKSNDGIEV